MKLIYIASPYTIGDHAANVRTQMEAAHRILDIGHCPITPLLSHFLHIHRHRPYDDWLRMDLAILKTADIVLRLPGESKGADAEVLRAIELKKLIAFGWDDLDFILEKHWIGGANE